MARAPKNAKLDKNPYLRRSEAVKDKAFKTGVKATKPVAKDTNKTRRPRKMPTCK